MTECVDVATAVYMEHTWSIYLASVCYNKWDKNIRRTKMDNEKFQELVLAEFGKMNKQFEKIDQKFDQIDQNFEKVFKKLDRLETLALQHRYNIVTNWI